MSSRDRNDPYLDERRPLKSSKYKSDDRASSRHTLDAEPHRDKSRSHQGRSRSRSPLRHDKSPVSARRDGEDRHHTGSHSMKGELPLYDRNPNRVPNPFTSSESRSIPPWDKDAPRVLTCWYWANKGDCSLPDSKCKFAHFDTGRTAEHPNTRFMASPVEKRSDVPQRIDAQHNEKIRNRESMPMSSNRQPPIGTRETLESRSQAQAQSRTSSRLEESLTRLLEGFGINLLEAAATRFSRDLAKSTLDYREAEFEKLRPHHEAHPEVGELERSSLATFRQEYGDVEKKLKRQTTEVKNAAEDFTKEIISHVSVADCHSCEKMQKQFNQYTGDQSKHTEAHGVSNGNVKQERTKIAELESEIHNLQAVNAEQASELSQLKSQIIKIVSDTRALQNSNSRVNELVDLRNRFDALTSQVKDTLTLRTDINRAAQDFQSVSESISSQYEALRLKVVRDATEADKALQDHIKTFQEHESESKSRQKLVDDTLQSLRSQTNIKKSPLQLHESHQNPSHPTPPASQTSLDTLKVEFDELRDGQRAADEYTGGLVQTLLERCEKLEKSFPFFRAQHDDKVKYIREEMQKMSDVFHSNDDILSEKIRNISNMVDEIQNRPHFQPQPGSDVDRAYVDKSIQEVQQQVMDEIQGTNQGLSTLEFRYSNLMTDQMANHILSQMDKAYPKLINLDKTIANLCNASQTQEHVRILHTQRLSALEANQNANQQQTGVSDTKRELAEVRDIVGSLSNRLEQLSATQPESMRATLGTLSSRLEQVSTTMSERIEGLSVSTKTVMEELTNSKADFIKANEDLITGIADCEARVIVLQEAIAGDISSQDSSTPAPQTNGKKRKHGSARFNPQHERDKRLRRNEGDFDDDE